MIAIKILLTILVLGCLGLASLSTAAGEIHQWRDKDGNLHFGDEPPANVTSKQIEVRTNSYTAQSLPDASGATGAPKVVMYSTTWCSYCKKAKAYFRANNIAYTEYDIEKSARARRDYKRLGGVGVPFIVVGDKTVRGFSVAKFTRAYAAR